MGSSSWNDNLPIIIITIIFVVVVVVVVISFVFLDGGLFKRSNAFGSKTRDILVSRAPHSWA